MTQASGPAHAHCRFCWGTGAVLNSDGKPGWRKPRICHHTGDWRPMTDAEIQLHHKRLTRLNENPTFGPIPQRPNPAPESNTEPSEGPTWVHSIRGAATALPEPRRDLDD